MNQIITNYCDNCNNKNSSKCNSCIAADSTTNTKPSKYEAKYDNVNNPSHYCEGRKYEPIKVIQDWELDFCLGNTVKYISRAGRKSSKGMSDLDKSIQDLEKAEFYLKYKIEELKSAREASDSKKATAAENPYQE